MMTTLPDILKDYRHSLKCQRIPNNFSYFALNANTIEQLRTPDIISEYNIWGFPTVNSSEFITNPKISNNIILQNVSPLHPADRNISHLSNGIMISSTSPYSIDESHFDKQNVDDSVIMSDISDESSSSSEISDISESPELSENNSPISSPEQMIIDSGSGSGSGSGSDDSGSDENYEILLPSMELIIPHKRVRLTPSCFINGCVCGHQFEFRDMAYENRKRRNTRCPGITIKPKTSPIAAKLRNNKISF
jgi:hypothetical protein